MISTICGNITRLLAHLSDIDKVMADQLRSQIAAEHVAVFGEYANVKFTQNHPHGYPESLKEDGESEMGSVATSPG